MLANEYVPVPPIAEQEAICKWITDESKPLDEVIQRAKDEIQLIGEYRDRLIADVVTGQIDVRGWKLDPDDIVTQEDIAGWSEMDENDESLDGDEMNDD